MYLGIVFSFSVSVSSEGTDRINETITEPEEARRDREREEHTSAAARRVGGQRVHGCLGGR